MAFEVFTKRMVPLAAAPYVTIQKRGTISINKAAHHLLGDPEAIELLYDLDEQIIGFRAVAPTVEHAYAIRKMGASTRTDNSATTYMVSGTAFLNYYEIDCSVARRYAVEVTDGVLRIDLKRGGTIVTGPREGKTKDRVPGRSFGRS